MNDSFYYAVTEVILISRYKGCPIGCQDYLFSNKRTWIVDKNGIIIELVSS